MEEFAHANQIQVRVIIAYLDTLRGQDACVMNAKNDILLTKHNQEFASPDPFPSEGGVWGRDYLVRCPD